VRIGNSVVNFFDDDFHRRLVLVNVGGLGGARSWSSGSLKAALLMLGHYQSTSPGSLISSLIVQP
jgi:hypothetical protein